MARPGARAMTPRLHGLQDRHPHVLGVPMQQFSPGIGLGVRSVARAYELAREALDDDIDIIVHCHNELDLPGAIKVAEV